MRIPVSIVCLALLASGCETCKPCPKPISEGSIVTQAKTFVADTATVVGYCIPKVQCAPAQVIAPGCAVTATAPAIPAPVTAPAGEMLIDTEKASLVRIRETPKTFTESSVFQKEPTK